MNIFNYLILLILFTSCAMFEQRDYSEQMDEFNFAEPMFEANRDFMVISGDSGVAHRLPSEVRRRTPATAEDAEEMRINASLNGELANLEMRLGQDQYDIFEQYRDKIGGVSEQIYYLRLSESGRREYLRVRRIVSTPVISNSYPKSSSVSNGAFGGVEHDVTLGMHKQSVLENWGTPIRRDIAGDRDSGNERWTFRRDGKLKYVYFEQGAVEGWSEQ